jgi:hypothetical protein
MFCEQFHTSHNDRLVVEDTFIYLNFVQRLLDAESGPVGPVRGHGFHDVRNCDDPRFREDPVAQEPAGIARSVHSFVVLQDDVGDGILEGP